MTLRSLESLRTEEAVLGLGTLSLREVSLVVADLGKLHLLTFSAQQVRHVKELLAGVGGLVGWVSLGYTVIITLTEKHLSFVSGACAMVAVVFHPPDRQQLTELYHV